MANTQQSNAALYAGVLAIVVIAGVGGYAAYTQREANLLEEDMSSSFRSSVDDGFLSSLSSFSSLSSPAASDAESSAPPLARLDQQRVEAYLGENIGNFIREDAGQDADAFYVTNIEWYTDNTAVVTYTDDDTIIRARFTATVDGGIVDIISFTEISRE